MQTKWIELTPSKLLTALPFSFVDLKYLQGRNNNVQLLKDSMWCDQVAI